MKELTLREIQLSSLEILKKFAEICQTAGLQYFLAYGTLLGAVRHKGFIPWDDDVDVIMPRSDYNKFVEYCRSNKENLRPLVLLHYSTNKKYIYPIARLSDSRYVADYFNSKEYGLGTFIDIYPLDDCGDDQSDFESAYNKLKCLIYITYCAGLKNFEKSTRGGLLFSSAKLLAFSLAQLIGPNRLSKIVDEKAQKLNLHDTSYSACIVWGDCRMTAVHKALLNEPIYVDFEDEKFRAPKEYGSVLTRWYGNYMELPPEDKRVGHHYYRIFKVE